MRAYGWYSGCIKHILCVCISAEEKGCEVWGFEYSKMPKGSFKRMNANSEPLEHSPSSEYCKARSSLCRPQSLRVPIIYRGFSLIRLYDPFITVIRVRDEWFLDRLDSEIATKNTVYSLMSEDGYPHIKGAYHWPATKASNSLPSFSRLPPRPI